MDTIGDRVEKGNIFMGVMIAILIFLSVTLFLAIAVSGSPGSADLWSFAVNDSQQWGNMYAGEDGTLYTTSGKDIQAIAFDGTIKWSLPVDYEPVIMYGASDEYDRIFLSLWYNENNVSLWGKELLAISPDGHVIWRLPLGPMGSAAITIVGDRLYRHNDFNVNVYDCDNGSLLWKVYAPHWQPAVDPRGNVYVEYDEYNTTSDQFTGELRSYDRDGKLRWARPFSDYGIDYREIGYGRLQALNDTLLMTDGFGLAAVSYDGNLLWHRNISYGASIYDVDEGGAIYLISWGSRDRTPHYPDFGIVNPDGSEKWLDGRALTEAMGQFREIYDGVAYFAKTHPAESDLTTDDLDTCDLYAYDLCDERVRWTKQIEFSPMTAILNTSSISRIMFDNIDICRVCKDNNVTPVYEYDWLEPESPGVKNRSDIRVLAGSDAVFVEYWAYTFPYPARFDLSTCTYAGGICALDDNGKLIWSRQTNSYVTSMTEKNGTIYYRTNNGRFSAASVDMTAGFMLAAAYLFFRFFMLGAVSRARSRLDKNTNRNMVLAFVADNPGASLYEIARALGMNVGTVRYHLLILSINHKISPAGNGPKSVGYFACSRLYSDEEKLMMSLMRRGQIRELLSILSSRPGLSNADIAAEMGLAESAVSRYMLELNRRGIVSRRRSENGKLTYRVEDKFLSALSDFISNSRPGYTVRNSVQEMPVAETSR